MRAGLWLAWLLMAGTLTAEPRRILLLYPESFYRPAVVSFDTAFRTHVRERYRSAVEFDMENVGAQHRVDPEVHAALHVLLRARYARSRPDVVVATVPEVYACLTNGSAPLFPGAPVIRLGIQPDDGDANGGSTNVCTVVWDVDAGLTLDLALRLQPETRRVVVVYGSSVLDARFSERILRDLAPYGERVELEAMTGLSLEEFAARMAALPPRTIALYGTIDHDSAGRHTIPLDVLKMLRRVSNAPIYSPYSSYLGHGVVGGHIVSFEAAGQIAAGMALRLLEGVAPETIGDEHAAGWGRTMVDWRELRRWDIPLSRLPAGTVVLHRPLSVWREYRRALVGLLATLLCLSAAVLILLLQRRRLLRTRGLLRKEQLELKRSQSELRRLADMLLQADEADKSRLARELHDDVSQRLAALALGMEHVDGMLGGDPKRARAAIADLRQALVALGRDLHDLSRRLHPAILDDLGLVRAVQSGCDSLGRSAGIGIHFFHDNVPADLPGRLALCLYRVAQEALTNAVKHARAGEVRVFLTGRAESLELVVEDEGVGFDPEAEHSGNGIGLSVMRERVRLAHGTISIFSQPGEGTSIRVQVPLERERHDEGASAAG